MIGEAVALVGAVLILLAAIGVVRFRDVLARMHALTKASTVGVLLVAIGSAFVLPTANDITSALAAAPAAADARRSAPPDRPGHLPGRGIAHRVDAVDELAASGVDRADDGDSAAGDR